MQDLDKALADIGNIRQQLAAGAMFRGFGPAVVALTGCFALAAAAVQAIWFAAASRDPMFYIGFWAAIAVVSAVCIGLEMYARTRRHHYGLADAMLFNAAEQLLPVGAAGTAIAIVLLRYAPDAAWMLPGLFEILIALGIFACSRFLPRRVAMAAAWYFIAGVTVLVLASETQILSPWLMGVPFGIGQFLLAALLHLSFGASDDETR